MKIQAVVIVNVGANTEAKKAIETILKLKSGSKLVEEQILNSFVSLFKKRLLLSI
mgnify:FL=1